MKRFITLIFQLVFLGLPIFLPFPGAYAQETVRYSCSAQIFEAFGMERITEFTKDTGIKVDLYISSSSAAVYRLMNDFSDIAGAAEPLHFRYREFGYSETPFCRDSLAVIISARCPVESLAIEQLRDIFGGSITNWKEVGGPDEPIIVIVPGEDTAAYKNFRSIAMEGREIIHSLMSARSTMVINAVKNIPWSISFIAHAAVKDQENLKFMKIGGLLPTDKDYHYFQTFYYVTKGSPTGPTKKFIDFTISEKGQAIIRAKGMIPVINRPEEGIRN
ncbi:ABC-type phosphate transport system periplasmic component PstS [uncultured Desulfobacterium sp.]|uniref:ABC-type phosphate transport system periplasmic component PstS n=1 Tax=uncultured Desulfobacterium sp. TaxID=201089 RepID=A0A445MYW3_9BACT|nr:ABC-type phosphate transport system periplasmic component PstS [uncultured Desulfobacterium sp.]